MSEDEDERAPRGGRVLETVQCVARCRRRPRTYERMTCRIYSYTLQIQYLN